MSASLHGQAWLATVGHLARWLLLRRFGDGVS